MTTADTLQLREQLLATLRRSPRPVSTTELAARMPWKVERSEYNCTVLRNPSRPIAGMEVVECHRDWHVVQYRRTAHGYTGIYRHLRSLEQQGLVRRALRQGRKRVCWVCVDADRPSVEITK
ncbi:hypothetical protein [Mycobacterium riyadhense]|uniref:Uncharacterized protein n=1 Tax=Mycobacterium riyadhense TaxID=486698 RepID=A0A1X2DI98_9MYCO|nr:hypothetical protein [Mycobacterium riyadhense]MCV7148260.1 hypothetical protein [Mycobacterium riyadhense]ORW87858.1 hypothetical protein AWC22_00075 [Mycobacterium riyadhense]VTP02464.1 hypothetical protein BIN_B_04523 [Mycobacterium riyadhense]